MDLLSLDKELFVQAFNKAHCLSFGYLSSMIYIKDYFSLNYYSNRFNKKNYNDREYDSMEISIEYC